MNEKKRKHTISHINKKKSSARIRRDLFYNLLESPTDKGKKKWIHMYLQDIGVTRELFNQFRLYHMSEIIGSYLVGFPDFISRFGNLAYGKGIFVIHVALCLINLIIPKDI